MCILLPIFYGKYLGKQNPLQIGYYFLPAKIRSPGSLSRAFSIRTITFFIFFMQNRKSLFKQVEITATALSPRQYSSL